MFEGLYLLCFLTMAAYLASITLAAADTDDTDNAAGAHTITRRSVRKSASIGGSCILECEINYPGDTEIQHMITWKKQGIEVPILIKFIRYPSHIDAGYQGRIRLIDQASIEISDIRIDDEGWYECTVVFIDGNDDTNTNGTWVYLSVNSPPVLGGVSPSFLIQKQGDTVDFYCDAAATPEPTMTWHKDNKELVPSDRVVVSGNRVQIKELVRSDGGVYMCLFKNSVGQVSHIIRLVIEGDKWITSGNAYIMVPPKNITAKEGEEVTLTCQAEGYPNNITYRWFKNDIDVQTMSTLISRGNVYADGSFMISALAKDDSGWYKCRPSNGLGPPPEAKAFLNVTYIPKVLSMPGRIYLPQGMMGQIECPVVANPPVNMITWTKDDKSIYPDRSPGLMLTKQGTLVFKSVSTADQGWYACTPHATTGTGHASTPVQVLVRDPPFFSLRPNPIYQRQPTQQVTLPCRAEGDPRPKIEWRKADGTFPPSTRTLHNEGNLTIVNLGMDDHGVYECVATNVVTSVIITSLLLIESTTPHAPYNVTVKTGQDFAKVSWFPAYDGGFPQHYVLWFRRKNQNTGYQRKSDALDSNDEWKTIRVIPEQATSITVYKLHSETEYEFTVLSRNRMGDGLFSGIATSTTTGAHEPTDDRHSDISTPIMDKSAPIGPVPAAPQNITIKQQRNGLMIRWSQFYSSFPLKHFLIEYRTIGRWDTLTTVPAENSYHLWTTASRGATYHFRLIACTETAQSKPSKAVSFSTVDPRHVGIRISDGMIGGIVGGLLFLFVAIILAVLAVKIFNKRKQREKAMRYGNVKYFGPKHMDSNKMKGPTGNHDGQSCVVAEIDAIPISENHCSSSSPQTHVKTVKETPI